MENKSLFVNYIISLIFIILLATILIYASYREGYTEGIDFERESSADREITAMKNCLSGKIDAYQYFDTWSAYTVENLFAQFYCPDLIKINKANK